MTELENKLHQIFQEKQDKIKPENIKKGIQIFDITGTYEGNSGDVKLFETEEQMQQDPNANEGDLAVVYREEIQNMTADSQTQFITFPETVTLPSTITESYHCMLRAADPSKMFEGNIMLDQNSFRFDGFTNTGMIRVSYTSIDGITYTREEFMGDSGELTNPVDLGTEIHCEMQEQWNDNFGYFMQIGGNTFEGLYTYQNYIMKNVYNCVNYTNNTKPEVNYKIPDLIARIDNGGHKPLIVVESSELDKSGKFYNIIKCKTYFQARLNSPKIAITADNKYYIIVEIVNNDSDDKVEQVRTTYDFTLENPIVETHNILKSEIDTFPIFGDRSSGQFTGQYTYFILEELLPNQTNIMECSAGSPAIITTTLNSTELGEGVVITTISNDNIYKCDNVTTASYLPASTQLTATVDKVYNSIYYGKDGVNEGTLTQNVSNSFADINAEVYSKIQQVYNNMEPRVLTDGDKEIDQNIHFIPTKLDGTPLLDTSNVTDMYVMFFKCENLTSIPQLNTSNVTNMNGTFENCTNLKTIANLNTSKVENMNSIFDGCENLISVPQFDTSSVIYMGAMFSRCQSLVEVPQFDTSKVTKMGSMFIGCTNLVTVPQFDMSSIVYSNLFNHDIQNMFSRCPSLSSDSLNNILKSLLTATSYTETKTLAYIGLSEEQATTCTTLSNWSACEAKGWTTGY